MSTVFVAVVLSVKKICLTINLCLRLLTSTRWHQTCGKKELPHGMLNTKEWEGVTIFLSLLLIQKMVILINWVSCVSYGWVVLIVPGATLGVDHSAMQLVIYFIVIRGDWLWKAANINDKNNSAAVYVQSTVKVHNPLFSVGKLLRNKLMQRFYWSIQSKW